MPCFLESFYNLERGCFHFFNYTFFVYLVGIDFCCLCVILSALKNFKFTKMGDKICEAVVSKLYHDEDFRVLNPDAVVHHEGATFSVEDFGHVRPVIVRPDEVEPGKEDSVLLFQSGYMMPPTSPFGERFVPPLIEELKKHNGVAAFYSPFGRGTEKPEERIGRISADEIRREVAACIKILLDSGDFNTEYPARVVLGGHSLGGQAALDILGNPEEYGFTNRDFSGALAYCPIPVPNSRWITRSWTPGKVNWDLFTGPVKMGALPVLKSLMTGNGVNFDKEKAKKFFGVEDDEVLDRLFRDSGVYFLQTLLTNSSEGISAGLRGKVVSIMAAPNDSIVTPIGIENTIHSFSAAGADVLGMQVPGRDSGHFSPFFTAEDQRPDVLFNTQLRSGELIRHVLEKPCSVGK